MSRAVQVRRGLVIAAVAAAAAVGLTAPAQAAAPTLNTSWAPWDTPNNRGTQNYTVARGTTVNMRCWTTGAYQLGTAKWFFVISNNYPYTRGYVPANAVSYQTTVGRC